jgi:hypothetical protein
MPLIRFTLLLLYSLFITVCAQDPRRHFRHLHLTAEFGYGGAYMSMQKLNDSYLQDFAIPAGMFDSYYHWCHFFSPEIGLIIKKNILSMAYQQYYGIMKGPYYVTPGGKTLKLKLYSLFPSFSVSYRRLFQGKIVTYALGSGISAGRGLFSISDRYQIMLPPTDMYAYGGGGSLFGDVYYILKGHIMLGVRISGNLIMTRSLKYFENNKIWNASGNEINLNYSGVSLLVRIGVLQ